VWFDTAAGEAARLYMSVFPESRITGTTVLHDTPSGTVEILTVELYGQAFTLMSAGPYFTLNPAVSFLVACPTLEEVERIWTALTPGGTPLMELGVYPFSERYGWLQDRFGLSWQIMYLGEQPVAQRIIPKLMFVGDVCGKAEEAINFYVAIFPDARVGDLMRFGPDAAPDQEGTIAHGVFTLAGQMFAAMDSAWPHQFAFNEAISFEVHCATQDEIDYFWDKLSAVPAAEQCGWLKDRYGLSWQIVPTVMTEMMRDPDPEKIARVTAAFLPMKKLDIATLQRAYEGT
jgi:predicted 3-demethylubiquinone-9 3-methyltransferase (glyoxalase superfamily)